MGKRRMRSLIEGSVATSLPAESRISHTSMTNDLNRSAMAEFLLQLPRWLLLAVAVYAPWAYGSTRPWAADILNYQLIFLNVCFLLSLVLKRKWPRIPGWAAFFMVALLGLGWWMTCNVYAVYDPRNFSLTPVVPLVEGWPGTRDQSISFERLLSWTGFFGAFCVACDMLSNTVWRNRLWVTLSLTGVSIALFGLGQRILGAPAIFWMRDEYSVTPMFFSTYLYHANAGAFINIVLPLTFGRAMLSFLNSSSHGLRAFWCLAFFVTATAAFVNLSRAAMSITVGLIVLMVFWLILKWRRRGHHRRWEAILGVGAILVAVVVFAVCFGLDMMQARWFSNPEDILNNPRYLTYDAILRYGLPAAGWQGFGPGTFQVVFPYFSEHYGDQIKGFWRDAHQDYLQMLIEWGWVGSAFWACWIFGGVFLGAGRLFRNYTKLSLEHRILLGSSLLALLSVLIHAMVDFPMQVPSVQLYVSTLLAFAWCLGVTNRKPRNEPARD